MHPMPLFIPIHTDPPQPDHKCPKCGHEWNDPSGPMTFKTALVGIGLGILVLFAIVFGCVAFIWFLEFLTDYRNRPMSEYFMDSMEVLFCGSKSFFGRLFS